MTTQILAGAAAVITIVSIAYFALAALSQLGMSGIAARSLWRHGHRGTPRARALVAYVRRPLVSIVVPAYNEELTIVNSIRALLALEYDAREIVVVNDGSSDGTVALLLRTFELLPAPLAYVQPLATRPVRAIYRSASNPALVVVDKENGGCKADASNAGINAASGTLVLVIDADTVLEPDALSRAVVPFLEDPSTIAVGASVGIANGCAIADGRVSSISLPRNWFARFQVLEYMRAFLVFRVACASANGVLILSGAFGLFRRDSVIAVGGFDPTAIGEDMDLTLRLQRDYRRRGERFRIGFDPSPLCWTQAPEDWASLRSQRYRWRRGLLQVIWRHRRMLGNPRYGIVGLGTFPYTTCFEGLGPLLEFAGYLATTAAVVAGAFDVRHYGMVVAIWILFGTSVSLLAVLLSDVATREYMSGRDLVLLVLVALLENCGYRQLNSWWGCVGTVQAMTGTGGWGTMKRRAFDTGS